MTTSPPSPRGIQSIEVGGALLRALAHQGQALALKDLAREAGMPAAKAHPYLVSFIKLGLVAQHEDGLYGLGPLALQLGLISLQQYDPVRLATPRIEALAAELGHTVAIVVWGNRGPTVVRVAHAPTPLHISMRHGTVMSLADTASGRLFAAHLPETLWRETLRAEGLAPAALRSAVAALRQRRDDALAWGLAQTLDEAVPGVSALAAAVLDQRGQLALSLTAVGPSSAFDATLQGPLAAALRRDALALTQQLGYQPQWQALPPA
ncbi:IclR family transcriptional regulator [Roseateles sp. BYS180W]|uniref:IclR family transcriptional regulator n=1 Tax=Roseateles rivi TaxID=3299028 RepID=A0ABW7FSD7_9BURK